MFFFFIKLAIIKKTILLSAGKDTGKQALPRPLLLKIQMGTYWYFVESNGTIFQSNAF